MPTFKVYVADRETGKESVLLYDAIDAEAAMRRASDDGWLVSTAKEAVSEDAPKAVSLPNTNLAVGGFLIVAGAVVFLAGFASWYTAGTSVSSWSGSETTIHPGERFQNDNAVGAAANSLDLLRLDIMRLEGVVLLAAGAIVAARNLPVTK